MYKIKIKNLHLKEIIGILDFERINKQNILIDFSCIYENKKQYVDYMDITNFIEQDIKTSKYLLIEDAIDSLKLKLTREFPSIKNIYLKITKPNILSNATISIESI